MDLQTPEFAFAHVPDLRELPQMNAKFRVVNVQLFPNKGKGTVVCLFAGVDLSIASPLMRHFYRFFFYQFDLKKKSEKSQISYGKRP